jgi:hypothetical protein
MKEKEHLKAQLKLANQYITELEKSLSLAQNLIQSQEQLIHHLIKPN